jgi:hypothetical protein
MAAQGLTARYLVRGYRPQAHALIAADGQALPVGVKSQRQRRPHPRCLDGNDLPACDIPAGQGGIRRRADQGAPVRAEG